MKLAIDVVIIATVRAGILRMTLDSFTKNLFHQFQARAIINVDPAGETDKATQLDMVEICREYFDEVKHNCPQQPSFAKAMQWGWQQVQTELFILVEDDWILKRQMDLAKCIAQFDNANVVNVCFNKTGERECIALLQRENCGVEWYADSFLHYPHIVCNPGIFRTAYMCELADKMDVKQDPEYQFRFGNHTTANYSAPIFIWQVAAESFVLETGEAWRRANYIAKHSDIGKETYWHSIDRDTRNFAKLRQLKRKVKYHFIRRRWRRKYC